MVTLITEQLQKQSLDEPACRAFSLNLVRCRHRLEVFGAEKAELCPCFLLDAHCMVCSNVSLTFPPAAVIKGDICSAVMRGFISVLIGQPPR
uniref:Uncharacterized protein n=1 Tax=Paramormyrops kingsleyae TaxID=1676925 RepID=A0A3B3S7R5_9TELE